MLDAVIKPRIAPFLDKAASKISQSGLGANTLTLIGFVFGFSGCFFAGMQIYPLALFMILAGRLIDGIDGPVARKTHETGLGAFLDMMCDFIIFAAFPFFFIMGAPEQSMAAAFLLFSYVFMGMAYLSHRLFTVKSGADDDAGGGIVENTEMILFMTICCLYPPGFAAFAAFFGLMCCTTAVLRMTRTVRILKKN